MCSRSIPIAQTILKPCKFSGRTQYAVSTTAFSRFSVISAALDDRAANLSNVYASYRITGVTFTVVAREATEVNLAVYFNSPTATTPTTVGELQDFPFYAQGSGLYGSPLPSISIKKHELDKFRQVKWFNTQLSSADTEFEYQFEVYAYAPFATLNYVVRIEYMVEFDASTDPNLVMRGGDWRELQRRARAASFGIDFDRKDALPSQLPPPRPGPPKANNASLDEDKIPHLVEEGANTPMTRQEFEIITSDDGRVPVVHSQSSSPALVLRTSKAALVAHPGPSRPQFPPGGNRK